MQDTNKKQQRKQNKKQANKRDRNKNKNKPVIKRQENAKRSQTQPPKNLPQMKQQKPKKKHKKHNRKEEPEFEILKKILKNKNSNDYRSNIDSIDKYFEERFKKLKKKIQIKNNENPHLKIQPKHPKSLLDKKTVFETENFFASIPIEQSKIILVDLVSKLIVKGPNKNGNKINEGFGKRMIIQLIFSAHPYICRSIGDAILKKFIVVKKKKSPVLQNSSLYSELSWFLYQVGNNDPEDFIRMWLDFLIPIISENFVPPESKFELVSILEMILKLKNETLKFSLNFNISSEHFCNFLRVIENAHKQQVQIQRYIVLSSTLESPESYQKKIDFLVKTENCFERCLPYLEEKSIFSNRNSSQLYFENLLLLLNLSKKWRIFMYLIQIIENDKKAYKTWLDCYSINILQSRKLLIYIMKNWKEIQNKIDKVELLKIVRTFKTITREIMNGIYKPKREKENEFKLVQYNLDELKKAIVTCRNFKKAIQPRFRLKNRTKFCLLILLFVLLLIFIVFVFWSKIFGKSATEENTQID
ncbi:transmembrane protein [Anaeramoeba ignava]|uniref:Transmembrane protein n=1 Tax=Anaeramoeba ignava TaxID=1746090 RepID=A0A9Q0LN28_ANAIG|nr:transmembrane protein [Anaeramoeba ignava]